MLQYFKNNIWRNTESDTKFTTLHARSCITMRYLPALLLPSDRNAAPVALACKRRGSAFSEKYAPFLRVEKTWMSFCCDAFYASTKTRSFHSPSPYTTEDSVRVAMDFQLEVRTSLNEHSNWNTSVKHLNGQIQLKLKNEACNSPPITIYYATCFQSATISWQLYYDSNKRTRSKLDITRLRLCVQGQIVLSC